MSRCVVLVWVAISILYRWPHFVANSVTVCLLFKTWRLPTCPPGNTGVGWGCSHAWFGIPYYHLCGVEGGKVVGHWDTLGKFVGLRPAPPSAPCLSLVERQSYAARWQAPPVRGRQACSWYQHTRPAQKGGNPCHCATGKRAAPSETLTGMPKEGLRSVTEGALPTAKT
jgi:hypothetical protein